MNMINLTFHENKLRSKHGQVFRGDYPLQWIVTPEINRYGNDRFWMNFEWILNESIWMYLDDQFWMIPRSGGRCDDRPPPGNRLWRPCLPGHGATRARYDARITDTSSPYDMAADELTDQPTTTNRWANMLRSQRCVQQNRGEQSPCVTWMERHGSMQQPSRVNQTSITGDNIE